MDGRRDDLRDGERNAIVWCRGVSPALEQDALLVFRKDSDGFLFEEDLLAAVTELDDSEQVVLEGGHDLAALGRNGGQVEVGGHGGGVDAAGGVSDVVCGGVRIDVADGGSWSNVHVNGTRVGIGCVRDGNSRRGGDTDRKRS